MVKTRLGFCDILTIPFFRPDTMCNFEVTTLKCLQITPISKFLDFRKRTSSYGYFVLLQLTNTRYGCFYGYLNEVTSFSQYFMN